MKVLFIASGNSKNFEVAPFIKSQAESLRERGIIVEYFPVLGKGIGGYVKSGSKLRAFLKENQFDLIHAHYTLSGLTATLARPKIPIILSLMGSDAYGEYIGPQKVKFSSRYLTLLTFFIQPFVQAIISKSANINKYVFRKKIANIIPNGVFIEKFTILEKENAKTDLGLNMDKKYILFLGNPEIKRKNYALAKKSVELLSNPEVELIAPFPVIHSDVVKYLNAADVFIMCAFMEGSPNVVKEAMACNCPIVATNVGDAAWVLGNTEGCFLTSFEPKDVAEKLKQALTFSKLKGKTKGRERIIELQLDSETIAQRIINLYKKVLEKREG